jgi:nicotinate-nucleotide pyrophosphorylase (carboxylating)
MSARGHDPIAVALTEDIGEGDITSQSFVPGDLDATARIIAKESGVVAGTNVAAQVFRRLDKDATVSVLRPDGSEVAPNEAVMEVKGKAQSLLTAERVALNFLQRLSGIATLTRQFVQAAANPAVQILDTRKTTPGLRKLERAAVLAGGGKNHRFGLFDMVLVKDNHLVLTSGASGLAQRISEIKKAHPKLKIELEADNLDQVRAFVELPGVDIILLDNMSPAQLREAVALRRNNIKFEASGGINLKNVHRVAATGIDYISVGALTHSARAIDFSLELIPAGG